MKNRTKSLSLTVCTLLIPLQMLLLYSQPLQAGKVINVGVVLDGQIEHGSWSPELFKNEIRTLVSDDFDVRFPLSSQIDGQWSATTIAAAHRRLQADPAVDMVLALGYVSSATAANTRPLQKPTFAPFIMDARLQGLPGRDNRSTVARLNYLSSGADFVRDLQVFNSVADCRSIAVLVDEANYVAQPGLIRRAQQVTASAGVELSFVVQRQRNEDLVARLPTGIDCVVVTDLARLDTQATSTLINKLIERKLPSYSLVDSSLVEQGLLMAEASATDWKRLARRNALNMHAVMHGQAAADQPISFQSKRQLTINMRTARAIGISPRFDILNEALLLHEQPAPQGRRLTLAEAAVEAVAANLDLRASTLGLKVGQKAVEEARARLLPQLNASIDHDRANDDSTLVVAGASAEQSTTAAITLSQLLYSDSVHADVEIQSLLQTNREALQRQLELDIIQETATAFLNVLKAQTFIQIRQQDLKLTRTNLDLARDRRQIGVANPAEVYRWESQLATSRQQLLDAQARLQQAQDALNRLLHRPLHEPFIAIPATLDDPSLIVSRKQLFDYVSNDHAYRLMGDFLVQEGLSQSPEVAAIEALKAASQREISARRRAYWSPTVSLQGRVSHVLDEQRVAGLPAEDDTDWSVGITVALPLYEGGARSARLHGSQAELSQLMAREDATRERIEQRIRVALHRIGASYPSIELSQSAATASKKNLELVTEAYSRGAVSILDLLDAQNAALVASESATNAVFDFLIDLMDLQRGAGRFDFFVSGSGLDDWLMRLHQYIQSNAQ